MNILTSVRNQVLNPNYYIQLYFFYTDKVYHGLNQKINGMEWYLPRKKQSYGTYLDSLLIDPNLINKEKGVLSQYFLLKTH
jgi:hypothetical protein